MELSFNSPFWYNLIMKNNQRIYFHKSFPVNVLAATNLVLILAILIAIVSNSQQIGHSLGLAINTLIVSTVALSVIIGGLVFVARKIFRIGNALNYLRSSLSVFLAGGLAVGTLSLIEIYRSGVQGRIFETKHVFLLIILFSFASFLVGVGHILGLRIFSKEK